jgi:lipoprotein NlpD
MTGTRAEGGGMRVNPDPRSRTRHSSLISHPSSLAVLAVIAALLAAGCGGAPPRAPVSERAAGETKSPPARVKAVPGEAEARPRLYTVKKGDTLYAIALEQGLDYRELAAWNNIENPTRLRIGQRLRLSPPEEAVVAAPAPPATQVEIRPLGLPAPSQVEATPLGALPPPGEARQTGAVKTGPKALKLPYSEQNLALIRGGAAAPAKPEPVPAEAPAPTPAPPAAEEPADEDAVAFAWPTQGKVIAPFTEASKGVDIAGRAGQPVFASAAGKVVYSGSGLRGYGKLIIIKHNKVYLSAYAHNDQLLVKEGQTVTKGQKIAEMGSTDSDRVKLHFEIRRYGKPVDPLKHLPELS